MPSANSTTATPTVAKRPKRSASTHSKAKTPAAKVKTVAAKTDELAHGAQVTAALLAESRAHCGQCGRELRHVPFLLKNIMCRECYGLDRYRRTAPPTSWKPEQQREVLLTDQKSVAAKS